jgi:hypothetical protein
MMRNFLRIDDDAIVVDYVNQDGSSKIRAGVVATLKSSEGTVPPKLLNCYAHMKINIKRPDWMRLLHNNDHFADIQTAIDVLIRARSQYAFDVLLLTFQYEFNGKGEETWINKFMAVYGREEWKHWYLVAPPPGQGCDQNPVESLNHVFHLINGSQRGLRAFLCEALLNLCVTIGTSLLHENNTYFTYRAVKNNEYHDMFWLLTHRQASRGRMLSRLPGPGGVC